MNRFASDSQKNDPGSGPSIILDSAPQSLVTVRAVFPRGPESDGRHRSFSSAVVPFPPGGCLALPEGTDEHRASIKSDSI